MNIDYFREFIVLADCGSYIEASERLFIGQSSLSKHIMSMEKELGVPLFERTSRKVILTRFGELMIPYANRIVQAQFDYRHALQTEQESTRGRITIGTISIVLQQHIFLI
ncbi:MAG: LysR family transcriptional regulator [Clostridiales bacterium]|nr:LysR family transcriptional regulator [Clostridiales bacterium]